jgi:hypothetical protein
MDTGMPGSCIRTTNLEVKEYLPVDKFKYYERTYFKKERMCDVKLTSL